MNDYERGRWEMFVTISSAYHGKQYYFLQDDKNIVYSRESGKCMTREKAYIEFLAHIGDF